MKTCELFVSVSINSGVACNLSQDLNSAAILNGERLSKEELPIVVQIRERLQAATSAIIEIEEKMRQL
jgi:hypothetical protein